MDSFGIPDSFHEPAPEGLRQVAHVEELTAFFDDAVNVVVLRRTVERALLAEARALLERAGPNLVLPLEPGRNDGLQLLARLEHAPLLAEDISGWSQVLRDLCDCRVVGVRLARLQSAMCPKFHVDKVTVRLVSTYVGAGTELLNAEGTIHRAPALAIVLLKGEAWPGNHGRGAVHRSPAASPSAPRLVLTLDALE